MRYSLLFLMALCVDSIGAEPPGEWIEPATGHRVIRLSQEGGTSSFYFHQNPYPASADKLVVAVPDGLATIHLKTREIKRIVEGRAAQVVVGKKKSEVFYTRENSVYATHAESGATRLIAKLPPEIRGG